MNLTAVIADMDLDVYDQKALSDSCRVGKRYSEKQVNEILGGYHEDTATLRRELMGYGLMKREGGGGEYWRVES